MTNDEAITNLNMISVAFVEPVTKEQRKLIDDTFDMAIKALEQTTWIPVSERLPEDGKNVLFCDIDDDIMLGYHVKGRPDTHFTQDGTFDDMKNVRAWIPVPESYKGE